MCLFWKKQVKSEEMWVYVPCVDGFLFITERYENIILGLLNRKLSLSEFETSKQDFNWNCAEELLWMYEHVFESTLCWCFFERFLIKNIHLVIISVRVDIHL